MKCKYYNYFIRYEWALILNKAKGVPIIPVYLSEVIGESNGKLLFEEFDISSIKMPDKEHHRDVSRSLTDNLKYRRILIEA